MAPPGRPGDAAGPGRRPSRSLIFGITITGILSTTLVAPAIPEIIDDFGVGGSGAGLLIAALTFPGIVVAPVIGLLADRYGRRAVLVPCLAVFGLFGGLGGLMPTFWLLILCRLLQGVGSAGLINLAVVIIGDHWDGTERARMIGHNSAVLTMSIAVLPPVGGLLTDLGGWRLAFAPYWLGLLTAALVGRSLPRSARRQVRMGDQLRDALAVVRRPHVTATIGTGFVVFLLVFGLFLTAMPIYAHEAFGLGAGTRGLLLGLPAIGSTAAALSLGRLNARFGSHRLVTAASLLFVIAFTIIGSVPVLWVTVAAVLVYGLGEGITIPGMQDLVAGAAPGESRGAVVAVWVGSARAGQTVGPLVAGQGVTAAGGQATFLAGAVVAAAMLAGQVVLRRRAPDLAAA